MNDHPAQPVERPVGLETEYGILKPGDPYANPVALASRLVGRRGEPIRLVRRLAATAETSKERA